MKINLQKSTDLPYTDLNIIVNYFYVYRSQGNTTGPNVENKSRLQLHRKKVDRQPFFFLNICKTLVTPKIRLGS